MPVLFITVVAMSGPGVPSTFQAQPASVRELCKRLYACGFGFAM